MSKNFTRIDVMSADEACKFYEFAAARGAKTRAEMEQAMEAFRKADIIVEMPKEHVEAHIMGTMKAIMVVPKGEQK